MARNIIKIMEDYYFCADKFQYTLLFKREKQTAPNLGINETKGEYIFEEIGFYASLKSMLDALQDKIIRREIESGDLETIQQIFYRLDEIKKSIDDFTE